MSKYADEGLTFDDVSFCTKYADFMPDETSVKSRFSRSIQINVPFVSAAMDTVTEADTAIAMARAGGIGIIASLFRVGRGRGRGRSAVPRWPGPDAHKGHIR